MKRKVVLSTLLSLLSFAVSLAVLFPLMGMKDIPFVNGESNRTDSNPPLTYYGGPVMPGTTNVYPIFWFPGEQGSMAGYISLVERYYQDVGGNRLYNMLTEYAGKNGTPTSTVLKDSWEDTTDNYPALIKLQDLINEIKIAIATKNWPNGGYDNYFPIYTAKRESGNGFRGKSWFFWPAG